MDKDVLFGALIVEFVLFWLVLYVEFLSFGFFLMLFLMVFGLWYASKL